MKVAYLLGSLPRGGTETLLLDVLRKTQSINLDTILIYRKEGLLSEEFRNIGVKMFKIFPKHYLDINYFVKLRRILKKENISIVHSHQLLDAFYVYTATISLNIKIILSLHGYYYNSSFIARRIHTYILNRTDLNIFVSKSLKNYYQEKYSLKPKNSQKVIYNGIYFSKFNNLYGNPIRRELQINSDILLMGSVGNFVPARHQMTICRFLKLLNEQGEKFVFVFVGTSTKKEAYLYDNCIQFCKRNNLLDKVFFLGSRNDVPGILKQLDVFIYSSNHDTFGIAVIEAMYAGIPVFINDWEVMTEITDDGKHGTIYKSKDEQDLLEKFTHFLQNKEIYKYKAQSDSVWVKENFSIETHLKKLHGVYTDLLKRNN